MSSPEPMPEAAPASGPPAALAAGVVIDGYRIERVASVSAAAAVYVAMDIALGVQVAIKEYLPARLATRDAAGQVIPLEEAAFERGLQAFLGEARALARCDDPCLLRVVRFAQSHGTGYRTMPWYQGKKLLDVRREMTLAPDEQVLRILLERLLDALEAFHATGQVHGAVAPGNILLLGDDRPLLLGPRWASQRSSSDLVDTLMASIRPPAPTVHELFAPAPDEALGPWTDLHALAGVLRYCITGHMPAPTGAGIGPGAAGWPESARATYSAQLLGVLDAALATDARARPQSVAEFRAWLEEPPASAASAADDDADSLIERVLQGVPERGARAAETAVEPVWQETDAAGPEASREPERPPVDARADMPSKAPDRSVSPALGGVVHAVWSRHRWATIGVALVLLAALGWLTMSLRDARQGLRVAWPPPENGAASAADASDALPVLPAEPTRAGPAVGAEAPTTPAPAPAEANTAPTAAPEPTKPPTASSHGAAHKAEAKPATPRELCSGRTHFATYRCMQTQCAKPRWTAHAQCREFRAAERAGP